MLQELYQTIDSPEEQGKNIKIPKTWTEAIYLSQRGELFCYTGIYGRDKDKVLFQSWPYYLEGKHSTKCDRLMRGLFRVKNGCILVSRFVDHEDHNDVSYKQLSNYIMRLPRVNSSFFGIEKRVEDERSWYFEEDENLSRACFGLSYSELDHFVKLYAEKLGTYNEYVQYPRITRSLKKDNFCNLTGLWIPAGFPYVNMNASGYDFEHVSLFGFYRYVSAFVTMGNRTISRLLGNDVLTAEIIDRINYIDSHFYGEVPVTKEHIYPNDY
ncbi:hypothetical protein [Paenibacillus tyrfis]|uniref:hypothetical protein n=1 Tax=Paenibacillus tyrfis TaxID=1501230 RepID=UPI000B589336|nr:hypothetical protein [Paenibacillus tyrfis]